MNTLTIITSYNRELNLRKIVSTLRSQNTDILIYDDCSNFTLNKYNFIRLNYNYGKEYLWMKFKKIFNEVPKTYEYYIFIPDDIEIKKDFIDKSVESWVKIQDKNKVCLSLMMDDRVKSPNWTNFNPEDKGFVIKTQWQDLCFICEKEFLEVEIQPISLKRWVILGKKLGIELGSGLGGQISRYFHSKNRTMYHLKEPTAKHLGVKSKMNPIERLVNPL